MPSPIACKFRVTADSVVCTCEGTPSMLGLADKHAIEAVLAAVAESIREVRQVPSGALHSALSQHGLIPLTTYQQILRILEASELITVRFHLITWIGAEAGSTTCDNCGRAYRYAPHSACPHCGRPVIAS